MRRVSIALLAIVSCAPRASLPNREEASCGRVVLSAVSPRRRRADLVLSVNGEVCHREPLFGGGWRGRITRMCGPAWFAPGENHVMLEVDPPGCAPPVARASVRCWLPEPD